MPGLQVKIPTTFSGGASLPLLAEDPLLSTGSLLLAEPGHPANPFVGTPVPNGAQLPNIAWKQAAKVLNVVNPTPSSLSSVFATATTPGAVSRSSKGGIVAIHASAATTGFYVKYPQALLDYLFANPGHSYFVSSWRRVIRPSGGTANAARAFSSLIHQTWTGPAGAAATAYMLHGFTSAEVNPNTTVTKRSQGLGQLGPAYWNIAAPVQNPSAVAYNPATVASFSSYFATGKGSPANAQVVTRAEDAVDYRHYIEDLTVSGRSYADVDAADFALYTKHVLSSGGRYYADTYPDPATVAA